MKFFGRFFGWIMLFLFLLGAIPILLLMESSNVAKLLGVLLVVAIVAALWYWRIQSRVRSPRNQRIRINTNDRFWLEDKIPFYKQLTPADKVIFEDRIGIFLADIVVTEVNKEVAEKETCFYVACSAVIAYWGMPYWNYGDLSEVLVYPSNFDIDNTLNKTGIVEGKVYHGGLMNNTMILSLPALTKGFQIDNDKKNVGVHEFAHLLDKSDGSIDGVPPQLGKEDRKLWIALVDKEIENIKKDDSNIPEYGATNRAEFFAVAVEYFKERPKLLKIKHPELFEALSKLFQHEQNSVKAE
jgi:Mlc titration factor MtfA (ptsG expression regulator)